MTPLLIEMLLHVHCTPEPYPRQDAPAVIEGFLILEDAGLIVRANERYRYVTTERGAAHIQQLCNLPFPTQGWIGADGKLITEAKP